jgi:hypothetical protein
MKDDTKNEQQFPEAGAVAYFGYKRIDGFEISLTLRDKTGAALLKRIDGAIKEVVGAGGTPLPLRGGGFPAKQAKPKDYVPNAVCPKDGGRLYYTETKKGKLIKCENSKYDFTTRTSSGCDYVKWPDPVPAPRVVPSDEIPERELVDY